MGGWYGHPLRHFQIYSLSTFCLNIVIMSVFLCDPECQATEIRHEKEMVILRS
jgi:hypothetical protein